MEGWGDLNLLLKPPNPPTTQGRRLAFNVVGAHGPIPNVDMGTPPEKNWVPELSLVGAFATTTLLDTVNSFLVQLQQQRGEDRIGLLIP